MLGVFTVQIALGSHRQTPATVLGQRVQHMIQEPNSGADGDLLGGRELGRVVGTFDGHNALLFGLGLGGVCRWGEVRHRLEGWEDTAIQGQRDLDLSLIGGP